MTDREFSVWSAVYAAAWFSAPAQKFAGHVTDEERAVIATGHADRAVAALKQVRPEVVE